MIAEWKDADGTIKTRDANSDLGGTMRLGAQSSDVAKGSLAHQIYGDVVSERPLYAAEKRLRLPIDEIPEEQREEQMTLVKMTPPQAAPAPTEKAGPRRVVDPLADDDDFQVLDQNGDPE